jgi:hypothetical protein
MSAFRQEDSMRVLMVGAMLAASASQAGAGPISKFDNRPPVGEYETSRSVEEIERCLIDMDGWLAPNVYRQPDRPNEVTLLWISGGTPAGTAAARIDLRKTASGSHAKSWMPAKQALACIGAP